MRISDWSSDVCSSDLKAEDAEATSQDGVQHDAGRISRTLGTAARLSDGSPQLRQAAEPAGQADRPRNPLAARPERLIPQGGRGSSEERRAGKVCASTGSSRW